MEREGIPEGFGGTQISIAVRIGALADLVEVAFRDRGIDGAIDIARTWSGVSLDPSLVDAWNGLAPTILAAVEGDDARDIVIEAAPNFPVAHEDLNAAFDLLADYADVKSPWFLGHSRAVAERTEAAARELQLPEADVVRARRAALLHDLGRASVPNSIWDKGGPLNADEWERVRLHAHFTERIVRRSAGLARLAPIAGAAHERMDGEGYPRGIAGETIPFLGRILGAADRYQAMREARPQRPALDESAAASELRRMARDGELDARAVDAVLTSAGHPRPRGAPGSAGLTQRELEVLALAARGATTRQIARELGITPKTAGNHIEHIYTKIGVSSRAEAAMFAMQHRLINTPP